MPEQETNKNKQYILAVLGLSVLLFFLSGAKTEPFKKPLGLAINTLGNNGNGATAAAQNYFPSAKSHTETVKINALSYLAAFMNKNGQIMILAEKNTNDLLAMASVTKLMTALVAYQNYDPEDIAVMPKNVNKWDGSSKRFIGGTTFKIRDLLYALLIESNNDAAIGLADKVGMENFVNKMNAEARRLGIVTTHYDNPTGLDPASGKEFINQSTASDLLKLTKEIVLNYPRILNITSLPQYDIKTSSGGFNHTAVNTDKFLSDKNGELLCQTKPVKILGGKTGFTDFAKKNLVLVSESPNYGGYLITVVLSANDNFAETAKLLNWICDSYDWSRPTKE